LPHDFPKWQTVYGYFRQWTKTGVWEQINDALRSAVRVAEGKESEPTAAIVDSQSVKTTEKGGYMGMMRVRRLTVANVISW
jgi:putative transposase